MGQCWPLWIITLDPIINQSHQMVAANDWDVKTTYPLDPSWISALNVHYEQCCHGYISSIALLLFYLIHAMFKIRPFPKYAPMVKITYFE